MMAAAIQSEHTTITDLAAQVQEALANAELLPATALEQLLDEAERAGLTGNREYTRLVGEWFAARGRELAAEQERLLEVAHETLAEAATGRTIRDGAWLAELLGAMWRLMLEGSAEYQQLRRLWLARFPEDALPVLVADWVRRWHKRKGQFVGFLASYLLHEYGAEVAGAISREQVEEQLARMATQGQIISAGIGKQVAMYATAAWLAQGGDGVAMVSKVGKQRMPG